MRRCLKLGLILIFSILTASCAFQRTPYLNTDFTQEAWRSHIVINANQWTKGADHWFLTGDPNSTEIADRQAPYSDAISTVKVDVSDFNNINTNGTYQVQIFGAAHNTLYMLGPNEGIRSVKVEMRDNTLYLSQPETPPKCINRVIVRIGVAKLNSLTQLGYGTIEGIRLNSPNLKIYDAGPGNIYLTGRINLRSISNKGSGTVSVFGAYAKGLDISTNNGNVNVSGYVNVKNISHGGEGDINLIGARSDGLCIDTKGKGKIGIYGMVKIKNISAKDDTCVYIANVCGNTVNINMYDYSKVGMSGSIRDLYVNTSGHSIFSGKDVYTYNAYATAQDFSHINIRASNTIFASATDNANIYYYGNPKHLSDFAKRNGSIIAMNIAK